MVPSGGAGLIWEVAHRRSLFAVFLGECNKQEVLILPRENTSHHNVKYCIKATVLAT
jgi:hypothetical protein